MKNKKSLGREKNIIKHGKKTLKIKIDWYFLILKNTSEIKSSNFFLEVWVFAFSGKHKKF